MLQLTVLVILFFSLTNITISYTCSSYCPNSYNYIGTADSSSCDSYSCRLACYNTQSPCSLWYNTYGSVCSNEANFYTPIYSSRTFLDWHQSMNLILIFFPMCLPLHFMECTSSILSIIVNLNLSFSSKWMVKRSLCTNRPRIGILQKLNLFCPLID